MPRFAAAAKSLSWQELLMHAVVLSTNSLLTHRHLVSNEVQFPKGAFAMQGREHSVERDVVNANSYKAKKKKNRRG